MKSMLLRMNECRIAKSKYQDEYNTQDQRMPQNPDMQGYRPQGENRTEYSEKMRNRERK
mgnify:CR=1 FL=1